MLGHEKTPDPTKHRNKYNMGTSNFREKTDN